jgi:hypothetical protein
LEVADYVPGPEEAPIVGSLEVGHDVGDEEHLSPPPLVALVVHVVSLVPDGTDAHVREQGPAGEEDKIKHWRKTQILRDVEVSDVSPGELSFGVVDLEQLVGSEESAKAHKVFHDDCSTNNDCKPVLGEVGLHHPWVDHLCVHRELRCQSQLCEDVAHELGTFKDIQLTIIPKLAA